MMTGGPGAQLVDGRFELLGRLGGGGMGLVWRARDTVLEREVALKEVRPPDPAMLAADPAAAFELRERVLREARALARLQHPHVVTIHHIVDTPELPHPWLVMELVAGGSLQDRLARGPLSPQEAARVGRGVLSALRAAHAAGIQHRDVKPANVLLRADGTPVLTDFGIAALSESTSLTATGALIGSPEFIAPERIRGHEGDPSSDLWSLGMTLYVAVEGHHPLRRATSIATLAAVLDEPLPPPRHSGPLGATLVALLSRDPADRPGPDQLDRLFAAAEQNVDGTLGGGTFAPTQLNTPAPWTATELNAPAPWTATELNATTAQVTARRRRRGPLLASAVAVVAAVGLLGWSLNGGGLHLPGRNRAADSAPQTLPDAGAGAGAGPSAGARAGADGVTATDLLTPDGARGLVEAIGSATNGATITQLVIRSEFATARVVTKDNPKHYDDLTYRSGRITSKPGGTLAAKEKPVDLGRVDWTLIPAGLAKARTELGVSAPKSPYLIVDYGWFADEITLRYYLSDEYGGGGYLSTGATGKVLKVAKSG
ncbi:serine/threonine protein kinase [Kitasatospora griseola]|uniref:non-specific serine/threonine protein kinase n=1 Tax=Kitasatospora griseola TaxID=2064 RepID=A0A0D0NG21_KITGR|nr:serine/threonine-protein kinase [Kitasatospora griseola]KIQ67260.1 serine/threonine protein kinase [Kitasatospora griseola]